MWGRGYVWMWSYWCVCVGVCVCVVGCCYVCVVVCVVGWSSVGVCVVGGCSVGVRMCVCVCVCVCVGVCGCVCVRGYVGTWSNSLSLVHDLYRVLALVRAMASPSTVLSRTPEREDGRRISAQSEPFHLINQNMAKQKSWTEVCLIHKPRGTGFVFT